ncbi:MAG: glycerophosphodiester phosphodiesterase [Gallionella sp.]
MSIYRVVAVNKTMIFAHRGANREAAENTRSAFEKALFNPIDGIETDIQLSRDGVPVLWHDDFLDKVGLPDKRIDDFDFVQLVKMDVAAHMFPGSESEGLMSLQAMIENYHQRCWLLLEIKNYEREAIPRLEEKVRKTLDVASMVQGKSIMVSSFDLDSLIYAQQYAPSFPLIYNLEPEQSIFDVQHVLADQSYLHGLCLPIAMLDQEIVSLMRAHDKLIAVYTCNTDDEIGRALQLGIDILISDVPQTALQAWNVMMEAR